MSILLLFPFLLPLLGSLLIMIIKERFTMGIAYIISFSTFISCLVCIFYVNTGTTLFKGEFFSLFWNPIGALFVCFSSALWFLNTLYSAGYCKSLNVKNMKQFQGFFCLSMACTMLTGVSSNLFTLLLAYEGLTLCTWPLIAHGGGEKAKKNARFYLLLLMSVSACFLVPAILWTLHLGGTTAFTDGGILSSSSMGQISLLLLVMMYGIGLGKMALFPVHRWLPRAMVASIPVSALLHAVAVVKTGAYSLIMIIKDIIGLEFFAGSLASIVLGSLGCFTLLWGAFIALRQDDLKGRLAYSTISQLSYVAIGVSLASPLAIVASAIHMLTHACAKMVLFMSVGNIMIVQKNRLLSTLSHVFTHLPWTYIALAIASASLIGIPPMIGIASKGLLLFSAIQAHSYIILMVLLVGSFLALLYLGQIARNGLYHSPAIDKPMPLPWHCHVATALTALLLLLIWPLLPSLISFLQT